MKKDIQNRLDIENILLFFYLKAFEDDLIGLFFTRVVPLDLNIHIPVISDFWEGIVFNKHKYSKNVMAIHQHISELHNFKKEHIDRWIKLFIKSVDEFNSGPNAERMKKTAVSIANLMQIKIVAPLNGNNS